MNNLKKILKVKLLIFISIIKIILNISMLESVEYINDNERKIDKYWLKICENVANKHSMQIVGMGGGMDKGKSNLLKISFEKTKKITQCEARKLILDCLNQLLFKINESLKLKPLLCNYPFTEKNIGVIIFFNDKENQEVLHPYLNTLSFYKGEIHYRTLGVENKYQYKTSESETFQEALQKVQCNE